MSDLLGKLLVALAAAVLGLLSAYLLRKRKIVEYDVSSMTLLKFKPKKERPLIVSFDKSVLTGNEEDKGVQVPVSSAYGFEVDVMNIGNEDITNISVEIRLNESAKVIEYETHPAVQTNYKVEVEKPLASPNVIRFLVPYINHKDRFLVRLISTENEKQR